MNGFKPPATMTTPNPQSVAEWVKDGMAFWARGEFFEQANYQRTYGSRTSFMAPNLQSLYFAGPLSTSVSLFVELQHQADDTDINANGDFIHHDSGLLVTELGERDVKLQLDKAFLMLDLPMLFGMHGMHDMSGMDMSHMDMSGHAMMHDMSGMDGGMATMGDGFIGHGPMVMIGRVDPSTNFSYPVDRQIFRDVPADTSEQGFLLRLPLNP